MLALRYDIYIYMSLSFKSLNTQDFPPDPCQYIFALMDFIIYNKDKLSKTSCIHSVHQGISIIFIDQNTNQYCSQKSTFYSGIKISNSLPPCETFLKKDKKKFKAASTKSLHTHCFYCVNELFMCNDDLSYCYCKILVVFCTVNLYILHIYGLFHILPSLLHSYGSMEYTYAHVSVCMFVCRIVRV